MSQVENKWFVARHSCPVCNHSQHKQILSIPYSDSTIWKYLESFYGWQGLIELSYLDEVNFILGKCEACDLIFQVYIPNDDLMMKLYEEWIDPSKVYNLIDGNRSVDYFIGYSKQIANIIYYFGGKPQRLDFLDFGMGWGHWCRVARGLGCNAVGHELSDARIQHASREGVPVLSWDEISRAKFDFINTDQVFEHIPSPLKTLEYLKNSLKPKGVIRIYVPNAWGVERKLGKFLTGKIDLGKINQVAPLEHINGFSYKSIMTMATQVGLKEVRIFPKYINSIGDFVYERISQPFFYFWGRRTTDVYLTIR